MMRLKDFDHGVRAILLSTVLLCPDEFFRALSISICTCATAVCSNGLLFRLDCPMR